MKSSNVCELLLRLGLSLGIGAAGCGSALDNPGRDGAAGAGAGGSGGASNTGGSSGGGSGGTTGFGGFGGGCSAPLANCPVFDSGPIPNADANSGDDGSAD
jgi:hypothetical protein